MTGEQKARSVRPTRPAFPYYGGKSRLARRIADLLPPHKVYVEPFAGSCAVLLAKEPCGHEVINDTWGDLVCLLRAIRDRPAELADLCRRTPYARDEFLTCEDRPSDLPELEVARRTWVRIVQSFAAATGPHHRLSWSISIENHTSDARAAQNLVDRFDAVSRRLCGVVIENRPAIEVVERLGRRSDVVIYADPPYLASTRKRAGGGNGGDYANDMASVDAHRELAAALTTSPATVLVSGYHSPLYDELYAGWHVTEIQSRRDSANRRGAAGAPSTEVIWSNRSLAGQESLSFVEEVVPA